MRDEDGVDMWGDRDFIGGHVLHDGLRGGDVEGCAAVEDTVEDGAVGAGVGFYTGALHLA